MANNLREWKSTFVGVVLFGIGIYQYMTDQSESWYHHIEDFVFAGLGIYFFLATDDQINKLLNGSIGAAFRYVKKKTGQ